MTPKERPVKGELMCILVCCVSVSEPEMIKMKAVIMYSCRHGAQRGCTTVTLMIFRLQRKRVWKHGPQRGNGGNVEEFGITKTDTHYYRLRPFQSMQRCRGDVTRKTCVRLTALPPGAPSHRFPTGRLQVALLGVAAGDGVQTSVLVQSLGPVGFVVDVMSDLLQVLEVRPGGHREHQPA